MVGFRHTYNEYLGLKCIDEMKVYQKVYQNWLSSQFNGNSFIRRRKTCSSCSAWCSHQTSNHITPNLIHHRNSKLESNCKASIYYYFIHLRAESLTMVGARYLTNCLHFTFTWNTGTCWILWAFWMNHVSASGAGAMVVMSLQWF